MDETEAASASVNAAFRDQQLRRAKKLREEADAVVERVPPVMMGVRLAVEERRRARRWERRPRRGPLPEWAHEKRSAESGAESAEPSDVGADDKAGKGAEIGKRKRADGSGPWAKRARGASRAADSPALPPGTVVETAAGSSGGAEARRASTKAQHPREKGHSQRAAAAKYGGWRYAGGTGERPDAGWVKVGEGRDGWTRGETDALLELVKRHGRRPVRTPPALRSCALLLTLFGPSCLRFMSLSLCL